MIRKIPTTLIGAAFLLAAAGCDSMPIASSNPLAAGRDQPLIAGDALGARIAEAPENKPAATAMNQDNTFNLATLDFDSGD